MIMVKPGGSGAAGVDVDVNPIALVGGRHEHVLTRVVAWIAVKCNHKIKVRLNLTKKLQLFISINIFQVIEFLFLMSKSSA